METKDAALMVARAHPRGVSQTRLLKLLWLAELEHYSKTGQRLTDANWFRYDHGPFSKDVLQTINQAEGFVHEQFISSHGVRSKLILPTTEPGAEQTPEAETLEEVLWKFSTYDTEELLDEVYAEPFFETTEFGHDFDFSRLPDHRRLPVSVEELEEARQARGERFGGPGGVLSGI